MLGRPRFRRKLALCALVLAAALAALASPAAAAGCDRCDFLITGRDGDSYTATRGNTVCVDESAIFTGSITLKGGAFEVCGTAIPSSVSFAPAGGTIVNHGTLRYFALTLERVEIDNHGVLLTYEGLSIGPEAGLVNRHGAFAGVGGELRNRGRAENDGVVDAAGHFANQGRFDNAGLVNAHRRLDNEGEFVNRGRINASELFRNAEGATFESHGGTVATLDLINEGLLFGEPSSGCNSFLVANLWRQPGRGELVGSLDYCAFGRGGEAPRAPEGRAARITSCACFNP